MWSTQRVVGSHGLGAESVGSLLPRLQGYPAAIMSALLFGLSNGKSISFPIWETSISVQLLVLSMVSEGAIQC